MIHTHNRGFTLIELLVVIAIIGILAGVVITNLGSARNKGRDAAVKSQLNAVRSAAELSASNHTSSYAFVCAEVAAALTGAAAPTGATVGAADAAQPNTTTVACDDAAGSWVISAPLSNSATAGFWCVDVVGASKAQAAGTLLGANATACP